MDTEPVTCAEIAELTAWARRLSTAGLTCADPGELADFRTAKHQLLARIQTTAPDTAKDQT